MTLEKSLKIPPRKKDTSLPVSSILIDSKSESDRATHTKVGRDAELRVAKILSKIYGNRNVITEGSFASGTNGKPDILLKLDLPILIEVKTCTLFHKKRIFGAAKTFLHSWERLTRYAQQRLMGRIIIVEYRHKGLAIYVWVDGNDVDRMIEDRKKSNPNFNVFHFEFREALKYGQILTERGFETEPIESSQQRIDSFFDLS